MKVRASPKGPRFQDLQTLNIIQKLGEPDSKTNQGRYKAELHIAVGT